VINILGTHLQKIGHTAHTEDDKVKYLIVHNLKFSTKIRKI
jgi:hypothetical protein